jgi:phosphoglycerate dehydrogenase-like enzyme
MRTLSVHILFEPDAEDLAVLLDGIAEGIEISTGDELPEQPAFEVLVAGRPTAEQISASPALGTLVIPYAGLPPTTRDLLADHPDLAVYNLHHNSPATTEMAVGLLLAASKMILPMDAALREGKWSGRGQANPAVLLAGQTALVYGHGAIGRRVARALAALGMRVVAIRRGEGPAVSDDGIEVRPASELDERLAEARVLMVCVPLTDETRGRIGDAELRRLPRGAVLVNVARGPVVVEDALFAALKDGHLHSAGLDVWYRYPGKDGDPEDTRPANQPFHELPNVVMSPHRGGWLHGIEAHRMRDLAELLNALASGSEAPGRVDPAAGY